MYEYSTVLKTASDGTASNHVFIVCADCGVLNTKDPKSGDWAAYDAPPRINPTSFTLEGRPETALCVECYVKAFQVRYPGAEPPTLYDGRVVERDN